MAGLYLRFDAGALMDESWAGELLLGACHCKKGRLWAWHLPLLYLALPPLHHSGSPSSPFPVFPFPAAVLQEVSELGVESVVGRPLLYQAHASTIAPSLVGKGELWGACRRSCGCMLCRASMRGPLHEAIHPPAHCAFAVRAVPCRVGARRHPVRQPHAHVPGHPLPLRAG